MPYYHYNEWKALQPIQQYSVRLDIKTLFVIGAHRFDEKDMIDMVFPNLKKIRLFEPDNELVHYLQQKFRLDNRVRTYPFAINNFDGETSFHVTNNEGASSSMYCKKADVCPEIKETSIKKIKVKSMKTCFEEYSWEYPDALFIDTEGSELGVLQTYPKKALDEVKVVFVEASVTPVYQGQEPTLPAILRLLSTDFTVVSSFPITDQDLAIGNTLLIRKEHVQ